MPNNRARRWSFIAATIVLVLAAIEGGAALTTAFLVQRGWMASIPASFSDRLVNDYFGYLDAAVGWKEFYPAVWSPCVSVYGDSFTVGAGKSAYPQQLSNLLGCNVANYGVSGYGSDQAMIRADTARLIDSAPVSIIGHVSENILRNLNQYRNLLYPGQEMFFKPRYVFDGDELRALPMPIAERADLRRLIDSPETVLMYDEFESRPRRSFPYTISLLRWLATDFHARAAMARRPRHQPFYHADHRAGGLQLTTAILSKFVMERARDHRTGVILLIPVGDDFKYVARGHRWPDQPLADALAKSDARVIHAGPRMMARIKGEDPCVLFQQCNGHFNAYGNRLLAEVVAESISDLVPPQPRARRNRSPAPVQNPPAAPRRDR